MTNLRPELKWMTDKKIRAIWITDDLFDKSVEGDKTKDDVLIRAYEGMQELLQRPVEHIPPKITERVFREIPGILPRLKGER